MLSRECLKPFSHEANGMCRRRGVGETGEHPGHHHILVFGRGVLKMLGK